MGIIANTVKQLDVSTPNVTLLTKQPNLKLANQDLPSSGVLMAGMSLMPFNVNLKVA